MMKSKRIVFLAMATLVACAALALQTTSSNQSSQGSGSASGSASASASASGNASAGGFANGTANSSSQRSGSTSEQNSQKGAMYDLAIDGDLDGEKVEVRSNLQSSLNAGSSSSQSIARGTDAEQIQRNMVALRIYSAIRSRIVAGIPQRANPGDKWNVALTPGTEIKARAIQYHYTKNAKADGRDVAVIVFQIVEPDSGNKPIHGEIALERSSSILYTLNVTLVDVQAGDRGMLNAIAREKRIR